MDKHLLELLNIDADLVLRLTELKGQLLTKGVTSEDTNLRDMIAKVELIKQDGGGTNPPDPPIDPPPGGGECDHVGVIADSFTISKVKMTKLVFDENQIITDNIKVGA